MVETLSTHILEVIRAVETRHRPDVLLLALLACGAAATLALPLLRQARHARETQRRNWCLLGGLILGFGGWVAFFTVIMGLETGEGYAPLMAILSLVVGIAGCEAAFWFAVQSRSPAGRASAALLLSAGLAAMLYTGLAALRVPALMHWDGHLVLASVLLPVALMLPAIHLTLRGRSAASLALAIGLVCIAILLLLAAGTTALSLTPTRMAEPGLAIPQDILAAWICAASAAIVAVSAFAHHMRGRQHAARLLGEHQFSQLVRGTSDYAICMLDRQGRVARWNVGAHALTGYMEDEAIGLPFACFFTAGDRAAGRPAKALAAALADGIAKGQWPCPRRDGSRFWAAGTIETLKDEDGAHIGFSLITRDITEIKQAQDALAATTERLDMALDHMLQGLCMFDGEERLVLANPAFYRIWSISTTQWKPGATLAEMVHAGCFAAGLGPADTLTMIRQSVRRAIEAGGTPSWTLEVNDDLVLAITESPVPGGGWIATFEDITAQRHSEAKIAHMAMHDALTGLPNRTRFYQGLDEMIAESGRSSDRLAVVAIDLDRFKEVNDTFGHASGDHLLRTIAERLDTVRRPNETIARLGGDEFAAAIRYGNRAELNDFIARIRGCIAAAVAAPDAEGGHQLLVGASLGIAVHPQDGPTRETLLSNADLAMYRAKASLGESVCFFEPGMDESARQRRLLANDLRHAVERGEMSLLYQPQRSLRTGELAGYEALLRWQHPRRGPVSPCEFIPIAEETGEIIALGEWVLRQACIEACTWPGEEKVAVNLSPVQFLQPELVEVVRGVLLETGLPARRLELEITETAIISDKLRALHCLRQIKAMGVSVAIDDFGTGYSSLDTLQSFPFDKIKIDKSFLMRSGESAQARAIIRAVLALGRSLEIPVLAEGVETEGQLRVLEAEGCDEAQGYYFGRPGLPPSAAAAPAAAGSRG
ncbi:EAL domain-containing protein [Novosphingobium resinovorum]|uniref:bifunctional diguanylate cyclase/phosphodiesterase n=1 Tax=Novosphingobium resinovorum TaxID=158500 RepID=UPI002ECFDEB9|nr:EAL domain-containing protein [Novosphingobium resinovorum]